MLNTKYTACATQIVILVCQTSDIFVVVRTYTKWNGQKNRGKCTFELNSSFFFKKKENKHVFLISFYIGYSLTRQKSPKINHIYATKSQTHIHTVHHNNSRQKKRGIQYQTESGQFLIFAYRRERGQKIGVTTINKYLIKYCSQLVQTMQKYEKLEKIGEGFHSFIHFLKS